NRTVKRLCADDSAATSVKVGHRQALIKKPSELIIQRVFALRVRFTQQHNFPQFQLYSNKTTVFLTSCPV
ncbi:hypothetical protein, partial [Collimonas silvisoli]|uniref:hypothetical protein n=1 Tax=Collimonas silvisoli TaxID=2825884 RepID=UPI001B8D79F0